MGFFAFTKSNGKVANVSAADPLPVDIGQNVSVQVGAEVEVKNDSGNPVPVAPNVQQGGGAVTATTTRVTLATDGPGVAALTSLDNKAPAARTPTTTSVASSATSVLLLAANANRRGLSIYNESTAVLRISHSNPATNGNHFATLQPGGFYGEDQQAYTTGAIYGIWSAANGSAQVRELT